MFHNVTVTTQRPEHPGGKFGMRPAGTRIVEVKTRLLYLDPLLKAVHTPVLDGVYALAPKKYTSEPPTAKMFEPHGSRSQYCI
jgi:hypothetical protein